MLTAGREAALLDAARGDDVVGGRPDFDRDQGGGPGERPAWVSPLDALDDGHLQDVDRAADAGEQGRTRGERLQKRISLGRAERPPARQVIRGRDHVGRASRRHSTACATVHVQTPRSTSRSRSPARGSAWLYRGVQSLYSPALRNETLDARART